jgi:hypothetical protein
VYRYFVTRSPSQSPSSRPQRITLGSVTNGSQIAPTSPSFLLLFLFLFSISSVSLESGTSAGTIFLAYPSRVCTSLVHEISHKSMSIDDLINT